MVNHFTSQKSKTISQQSSVKFSEFVYERPDLAAFSSGFQQLLSKFGQSPSFDQQNEVIQEFNEMRTEL
ncbi:MAG: hypothetical protein SFU99_19330, partial [Saprospiraceae bacterium]|nr:hypothetical protein [Saprospiraceae bacterium]